MLYRHLSKIDLNLSYKDKKIEFLGRLREVYKTRRSRQTTFKIIPYPVPFSITRKDSGPMDSDSAPILAGLYPFSLPSTPLCP